MVETGRSGHRLSSGVEGARRKVPGGSHSRCRLWRDLAWSKKLERRSDPDAGCAADGNPPRLARRPRRYPQPVHGGGDRRHDRRMPLSAKWQSRAGTEVRLQTALVRPADRHAEMLLASGEPVVLAGDYNVPPTDLDVYAPERWVDDALFRPEVRKAYAEFVELGWSDALRDLYPGNR